MVAMYASRDHARDQKCCWPSPSLSPSRTVARDMPKRKRTSFEASPALATELNALRSFRTEAVTSVHRNGSKVSVSTANANEKRLLAFFAFLAIEKSVLVETLRFRSCCRCYALPAALLLLLLAET